MREADSSHPHSTLQNASASPGQSALKGEIIKAVLSAQGIFWFTDQKFSLNQLEMKILLPVFVRVLGSSAFPLFSLKIFNVIQVVFKKTQLFIRSREILRQKGIMDNFVTAKVLPKFSSDSWSPQNCRPLW